MNLNRLKLPRQKASPFMKILLGLLLVAGIAILVSAIRTNLMNAEHYLRVYNNPITVTAEVTAHDEESDSDSGTDYLSYITYTVEGKVYKNVQYENVSSKNKRTALGTQVTVQVSPEEPGTLITKLKNTAGLDISTVVVAIAVSIASGLLRKTRLSKGNIGTPDSETVASDLLVMVRGRSLRVFWLLEGLALTALKLRYPMLYSGTFATVALGLCIVFWLLCMYSAIRDTRCIRNGDFSLHWDKLVRKEEKEDSEGYPTYYLYYTSNGRSWERSVSYAEFQKAEIGIQICAVYLAEQKRPALYYDASGDAH